MSHTVRDMAALVRPPLTSVTFALSGSSVSALFLQISFDLAEYTADVDGVGTLRLLDAIKTCGLINSVKFYQASTSELYGKVQEIPQKETTPFYPRSPYGEPGPCPAVRTAPLWAEGVCFCFLVLFVSPD